MIKTKNLKKAYGEHIALHDLNINVKSGDIFCLLGANGAGKSTTINLLLGFISPTSGNAFINQINVNKDPKATKQFLAYIPENLMLYPNLTAIENLDYFSGIAGKQKPNFIFLKRNATKSRNSHSPSERCQSITS